MAAPEDIVVLYRGCSKADARRMRDAMTAGGSPVDEHCGQPSERDVAAQADAARRERLPAGLLAHGNLPRFTHRIDSLAPYRPEAGPDIVMGVVQVWIRRRYLAQGEAGSVHAWCARHEAPIERWAFKTVATSLACDGPAARPPLLLKI